MQYLSVSTDSNPFRKNGKQHSKPGLQEKKSSFLNQTTCNHQTKTTQNQKISAKMTFEDIRAAVLANFFDGLVESFTVGFVLIVLEILLNPSDNPPQFS